MSSAGSIELRSSFENNLNFFCFFSYSTVQVYVVDHCENITQKPGLVVTHSITIVVQSVLLDQKSRHVNTWSSPRDTQEASCGVPLALY